MRHRPPPRLAIAILAAGQSRRFGAADKLTAPFRGKALGLHVADALARQPALQRWVIVRTADHPCQSGWRAAGFEPVVNPDAAQGQGTSLRCAAQLADQAGADALMVCLADMPLVPPAHFAALVAAWQHHAGIVASHDGALISPPAIFARPFFGTLAAASGDHGARHLLTGAHLVASPAGALTDIDDPLTLQRLSA